MGPFESTGRSHIFQEEIPARFLIIVIYWIVGVDGCDQRYVWMINRVGVCIVGIK